ncbi:leukocidin family pore-forming toxin [Bacillus thuringiensis]|uniref:Alpha-hemolysin n=1 Tax=Bacillus thuringiensis Bt18247 TaxID=1423143 RepID=A0A9W3XBY4_BACTU|nr:leukocidin family pore-forming toxin [Bacillus thuringiensis]AOM14315.1 alpha-hemolysin [Bacillus thuringiensis Bt18247]MBG9524806.1 hypothetical protein [Bacillus thuringiensis]
MKYKKNLFAGILSTLILVTPVTSFAAETEDIGEGTKVYTDYITKDITAGKVALKLSIIDDPNSPVLQGIITTDGTHIKPYMQKSPIDNTNARMTWPSSYGVKLSVETGKFEVPTSEKIFKVAPVNTNKNSTVTNTIDYGIGGNIDISKDGPSAGSEGKIDWSRSVSYEQPNYETILEKNTTKDVVWNTKFVSFAHGNRAWTRDSIASFPKVSGNELFMKSSGASGSAINNFTPDNELPPLIQGGFEPNMVAVITADKKETYGPLTMKIVVNTDDYRLNWVTPFSWQGVNHKDIFYTNLSNHNQFNGDITVQCNIDWQNHRFIK